MSQGNPSDASGGFGPPTSLQKGGDNVKVLIVIVILFLTGCCGTQLHNQIAHNWKALWYGSFGTGPDCDCGGYYEHPNADQYFLKDSEGKIIEL